LAAFACKGCDLWDVFVCMLGTFFALEIEGTEIGVI
jgi:hypothetical protein